MRRRGEADARAAARVCATRCERRVRWWRWRHDAVRARVCGARRRRRRGFRAHGVYISGVIEPPLLTNYDSRVRVLGTFLRSAVVDPRVRDARACARRERQRGEGVALENFHLCARVRERVRHSASVCAQCARRRSKTARNRKSGFLIFIFDDDGFRAVVV